MGMLVFFLLSLLGARAELSVEDRQVLDRLLRDHSADAATHFALDHHQTPEQVLEKLEYLETKRGIGFKGLDDRGSNFPFKEANWDQRKRFVDLVIEVNPFAPGHLAQQWFSKAQDAEEVAGILGLHELMRLQAFYYNLPYVQSKLWKYEDFKKVFDSIPVEDQGKVLTFFFRPFEKTKIKDISGLYLNAMDYLISDAPPEVVAKVEEELGGSKFLFSEEVAEVFKKDKIPALFQRARFQKLLRKLPRSSALRQDLQQSGAKQWCGAYVLNQALYRVLGSSMGVD